MAKAYAVVVGLILFVLGAAGFARTEMMGFHFNPVHNLIHLVTGLAGLWAGFGKSANGPRVFAQIFGVVYTLVAIAGFAGTPAVLTTTLLLDRGYNIVHLVVGVLGLVVGFSGAPKQATA